MDKSSFKLVQLYLSGDKVYSGCEADLIGEASDFETNLGYNLDDEQILDMNYVAKHIGKKSTSRITASGALAGKSYKIFRGTIDFVNGAKASVGNENEDVLILDDGVINKTIPLILCAEEDVEGNHGATIGKPDEDILFYLASRGIDEKESLRMLKLAKLDVAASHICDDEYRAEILRYIHGDTE